MSIFLSVQNATELSTQVNVVNYGDIADYIHAMAMSQDGRELVVAHGQQLSMIRDPFARKNMPCLHHGHY